jgi:hypothetical protein
VVDDSSIEQCLEQCDEAFTVLAFNPSSLLLLLLEFIPLEVFNEFFKGLQQI